MKKIILIAITIVIATGMIFVSCQKKENIHSDIDVSKSTGIQNVKDFESLYSPAITTSIKKEDRRLVQNVFSKISKETFIVLRDNLVFDKSGNFHGLGKGLHQLEKELTDKELEQFFTIINGKKTTLAPDGFKKPEDCGCTEKDMNKEKQVQPGTNKLPPCEWIELKDHRWIQDENCAYFLDATCRIKICN